MPYLDVADLALYYEEHEPSGCQPLVLLHGGGGTADDPVGGWALLLPAFSPPSCICVQMEDEGSG